MSTDWRRAIETQREEKDQYFGDNPHSPIPDEDRESFDGFEYYPIDETYWVELPLHEYDDPERLTVGTSTDGEQEYLRWGEFRFIIDGEDVALQAYKSDPDDERLWVPFQDVTSGDETYGPADISTSNTTAIGRATGTGFSTSTRRTTRRVRIPPNTSARSRRQRTGSRSRSRPESGRIDDLLTAHGGSNRDSGNRPRPDQKIRS